MRNLAYGAWIALTFVPLPAQESAALETLHVRVVHGVTGAPIPEADVSLLDEFFQSAAGPVTTDEKGNVGLTAAPGSYFLNVADIPGLSQPVPRNFFPIKIVRAGAASDVVTYRMIPGATVSGFVRDEFGEPVQQARLLILRAGWSEGAVRFYPVGAANTDDRGVYRVFSMPAGNYAVCAQVHGARQVPLAGVADLSALPTARFYEPTCAPVPEPSVSSSLLRIAAGEHANVDLVMRSASRLEIKGRLRTEQQGMSLSLRSDSPWGESASANTRTEGGEQVFVFRGVRPGKYWLEGQTGLPGTNGETKNMVVRMPVDARVGSTVELDVMPQPSATLHVTYEEAAPGLSKQVQQVGLHLAEGASFSDLREKDGDASITGVAAGTYWLQHMMRREGACIAGAKLGGKDVFRQLIQVTPGMDEQLVMAVSSVCGAIEGRVVANGTPVADASVTVLLSGTPSKPGFCFTMTSDENGAFRLSGIAPGRYLLWAWKDDGSSPAPASLTEVESSATVVDLQPGTTQTQVRLLGFAVDPGGDAR